VDLGTGDGRFVLATARAHPGALVIGIDPVATAMAEASRRAAQPTARGGLPNAAFVAGSAEAPPLELVGHASLVTVNLPWGSLLRGALAMDATAAAGIASLVEPGGRVSVLLAPADRDGLGDEADVRVRSAGSLAADWGPLGLDLAGCRPATAEDIAATPTTWGRRLGLGRGDGREAWLLDLRRRP
jgi:16S rRNA (adenine(1408)-N(1))-methyltransferase